MVRSSELSLLERLEQPADLRVGKRDLADVQVVPVGRSIRLRRVVRTMGIVEMRPQKEAGFADRVEPAESRRSSRRPPAAGGSPASARSTLADALVHLESLLQAAIGAQHHRSDESSGPKTSRRAESPPSSSRASCERGIRVVADAVVGRQQSGEQARVRGQRERGDRCGLIEDARPRERAARDAAATRS